MLLILPFLATLVAGNTNEIWVKLLPTEINSLDVPPSVLQTINNELAFAVRPKRDQPQYLPVPVTEQVVEPTTVQVTETVECAAGYIVDVHGNCGLETVEQHGAPTAEDNISLPTVVETEGIRASTSPTYDFQSGPDSVSSEATVPEICAEGLVHNHEGTCVQPKIIRNILLYNAPRLPVTVIKPEHVPEPTIHVNYVFVKVPEQPAAPEPIIAPPPQQRTLLYVLRKNEKRQQNLIQVESSNNEPEVFFVNYNEDDDLQELPGGIDLRTALEKAQGNAANIVTIDTGSDDDTFVSTENDVDAGDSTSGLSQEANLADYQDSTSDGSESHTNTNTNDSDTGSATGSADHDAGTESSAGVADFDSPSATYNARIVRRNAFRERLARNSLRNRKAKTIATNSEAAASGFRQARKPGFRIQRVRNTSA